MKSIESKKTPPMVARDASWMYFNHRILQEAQRSTVPLLERLNFLGIYLSNLDEFFRVRVATLNRIVEADDDKTLKKVREQARHTLRQIARLNASYSAEFSDTMQTVSQLLRDEHILILSDTEVDDAQKDFIRNYYRSHLNGTIQPVWLSAISNLADEADDSIYLAIRLTQWHSDRKRPVRDYALVRIPRDLDRFVRLPDRDGCCCIMYLDDDIRICMPLVFVGQDFSQFEAYAFKFTKDAEMEIDNGHECGKLQKVQRGVRSRKRGEPMRVIYDGRMPRDLLKKVMKHLGVNHQDTASAGGRYQNHRDLMSFPDCGRSDLRYAPMPPVRSADFDTDGSQLGTIASRDLFLHVPYQSFDGYIRFLREAANGREVARLIMRRTGVRIEIISGSTEASIICDSRFGRAVASQPDVAMVDVGGGSTEVSLTLGGRKCLSVSFNVGTIRLLHQTDAQRAQALSSLASDLALRCVQLLPQGGVDIVGSGGNINKLRRLAGKDSKDDQPLTVADLERLLADLKPLTLRQRMERYGMKPDRADVIVPAAEIFLTIAEVLGAKHIAVPILGLADGIIDDMYARHCAAARLGAGRRK